MLINCIAWFILILSSHKFCVWKENSYKCIFNKVRHKNNYVQAFFSANYSLCVFSKFDYYFNAKSRFAMVQNKRKIYFKNYIFVSIILW